MPRCVRCDKILDNIMDEGFQPLDGLAFRTYGHYGSTYFDPMTGEYLEICLCDVCVEILDTGGLVYNGTLT